MEREIAKGSSPLKLEHIEFQYLMGHSDIGVTLNTYTHLGAEDAKEELGKYAKMA